ncbi:glutathione S-transferase 1-like [Toxorhynchites rutilus septentrionalis]|uniref:glutathione S-transferase 1-like n=1 Tax=Toxorhynchites rutilus septentrionalis TaxID=329112 RepID=UPI002479B61E|nr:glutathione S-transferase 1-like [Toxorhynchites rutilus septentrionalis]
MSTIALYCHIAAPFCRSVLLLAKALGIEVNLIKLDVLSGEQFKPKFLELNPQHCVPTLVDGDVVVWESNAILIYLAEKYGTEERSYYPKDIAERAQVNRLLFFQLGTLHRALSTYYFPILAGIGEGKPEDFRKVLDAVSVLDKFLDGNKWLAGDKLSVADFSTVITVASLDGIDIFDLTRFQHISRWYQQCKDEFIGFKELTMEAVEKSKECIEALRQLKRNEFQQANKPSCSSEGSNERKSNDSNKPNSLS